MKIVIWSTKCLRKGYRRKVCVSLFTSKFHTKFRKGIMHQGGVVPIAFHSCILIPLDKGNKFGQMRFHSHSELEISAVNHSIPKGKTKRQTGHYDSSPVEEEQWENWNVIVCHIETQRNSLRINYVHNCEDLSSFDFVSAFLIVFISTA